MHRTIPLQPLNTAILLFLGHIGYMWGFMEWSWVMGQSEDYKERQAFVYSKPFVLGTLSPLAVVYGIQVC